MSGELRTSQFRWTTTADDDFVIGNPNNIGTTTKYLIFQTNTNSGPTNNPHLKCVHSGGGWELFINTNGTDTFNLTDAAYKSSINVFSGATNTFSTPVITNGTLTANGVSTFIGTTNISGTTNATGNVVLGTVSASGTLIVNADTTTINSPAFAVTGSIASSSSATTISSTSTTISSTNFYVKDPLITLNRTGAASSATGAGIEVEENAVITGYFKVSSGETGWDLKAPATAGVITLLPTATSVSLTLPASTGTLALKADVLPTVMGGGYTPTAGVIGVSDSILTAIEKLDYNVTAFSASSAPWVYSSPHIYYYGSGTGDVSIGTTSAPPAGAKLYVEGGSIVNYGGGANSSNAAFGGLALDANGAGTFNTAIGQSALHANTSGSENTAVGNSALVTNIVGANNTAVGLFALFTSNTSDNTAIGSNALKLATGHQNTAIGSSAAFNASSGINNVAVGFQALYGNTSASNNVGIGFNSLVGVGGPIGDGNVAIGTLTLSNSTTANQVAVGYSALYNNTTGVGNTAIGYQTLLNNAEGAYNTAIGHNAGTLTGSHGCTNCTFIGANSSPSISVSFDNSTAVGANAMISANNQIMLGNSFVTAVKTVATITAAAFNGTGGYSEPAIFPITATVASNNLTITLSPTVINFRSSTSNDGTITPLIISSPLTLVVPNGATLGTLSAQSNSLVVMVINYNGTPYLSVMNMNNSTNLDETLNLSAVAITSGSNSATTAYAPVLVPSYAFRVVGYIVITEATAGVWATAPSLIQGKGGLALSSMQSLGWGQQWTLQTSYRTGGVTYYNLNSRPIFVKVSGTVAGTILAIVNGFHLPGASIDMFFIVPPYGSYSASGWGGTMSWSELR